MVELDGELSGGGHGEYHGAGQPERTVFRAVRSRRERLHWSAVPRGAVHDRLRVGREARRVDAPPLEGQTLEPERLCGRREDRGTEEEAGSGAEDERERGRRDPATSPRARRRRRLESAGGGGLGEVVANALQVPREILGRGVALFGILGEAALH